ncbi:MULTISPECIES: tetratricopeptide repeat protein [Variovorax]|jgi:Flp pilus assembly protein TadD|uniref:tetratricopeptide repeat protein n=1 Tax=Variovorax TaxID=34072 RepID=UPI000897BC2E|nr:MULTISPECIES: tetratricopeptide repeat protein [Variovorax]UVH60104.1 tetratricopeptide repeat protein [Variovorax paradoxus]SDY07919.1 Tetratricopeptide repeat-containing protein [Variovorax sp. YR634]SDZ34837.1 Tetratricopeptide repeat-containing protein [Variovorax sp. YR266]SES79423.1 Tetratricopeptide repeat-containing protein [Variovorax sp. OV084]SOD27571.1 Tetratricopeptide repeat-containing protein [Variovorax sp. YR752]
MKHAAFSRLSIAFALLFSLWGSAVHANEYDDVNALLRQGKSNEALAKADTYIAGKPRDPQMRFLRGVILTEQNKQAEAITAFTQLTQDFPELSEPYNNLAALYASQSKFDQARNALEQALKLNPNYATAHENLGDVYARLAAQEYVRAQQFASTNASVAPKLALIRQIFSSKAEAEAAALPAPPVVIRKPVGRTSK